MITHKLFNALNISKYPDGIKPVPHDRIEGTAFFPGGDGLYEHKIFPEEGIMILGQDFDNEENFKVSKQSRSEITKPKGNPTWNNLIKILGDKIPIENYFFTNAIMGLREGSVKNTGRSKAFLKKNEQFLTECRDFFIEQLKAQKPKLIIGLGAHIPRFLSGTTENLKHLSSTTSLSKIEGGIDDNLFKDVVFKDIPDYKAKVIFITHPSLYYANVINRKKDDKEFEAKLIAKALENIPK
jgi:hypothetical protein